jgi:hypothetical protein
VFLFWFALDLVNFERVPRASFKPVVALSYSSVDLQSVRAGKGNTSCRLI